MTSLWLTSSPSSRWRYTSRCWRMVSISERPCSSSTLRTVSLRVSMSTGRASRTGPEMSMFLLFPSQRIALRIAL